MSQPHCRKRVAIVLAFSLLGIQTQGVCLLQDLPGNVAVIRPGESMEDILLKAAHVVPSPRQRAWQELEFIAFAHFGMDTFTDREWGEGTEEPAWFHPTDFDARQWARVIKDAGMKLLIVTAKHHDGFCLWPSRFTEHSVRNSPWRGGKGDVIREVAEACRAEGLKFGVYVSPWDRHEPSYGDSPAYNEHFRNQLRELLTQYGSVAEVWFDGACGEGPNGKKQVYDWPSYYAVIRELQPGAVIAIMGPDVRWVGTESGYGRETEWSVVPDILRNPVTIAAGSQLEAGDAAFVPADLTAEDLGSRDKIRHASTLAWYPAEIDVSIRPGWFYHKSQDARVKSPEELVDIYYSSVGRNGVLLLNIPPDRRGRIHEEDAKNLKGMKKILDETLSVDLAAGAEATASSEDAAHRAALLLDGNAGTYWTPEAGVEQATVHLELPMERTFDRALLQEAISVGQRIEQFTLEAWDGAEWRAFAGGTTVGYKRLLRFPPLTAKEVRIRIHQSRTRPTLTALSLFLSPPVVHIDPSGGAFVDSVRMVLSLSHAGGDIRFTLDGGEPTARSPLYTGPVTLTETATVVAAAFTGGRMAGVSVTASFQKAPYGILLSTAWSPRYPAGGTLALLDGVRGSQDFSDGHWQGYEGSNLEAVIDLGSVRPLERISAGFLQNQESWIFLPKAVMVDLSPDGAHYQNVAVLTHDVPVTREGPVIRTFQAVVGGREARFIRLRAETLGVCPPSHPGAGKKAWIFADEILVE